mmetsp:Transcript_46202/g.91074  ORF Transcript_46202/g.91074 Transcript_46202/m.91074 type:complete len:223 (-) Transcript_46202:920-1588(-)
MEETQIKQLYEEALDSSLDESVDGLRVALCQLLSTDPLSRQDLAARALPEDLRYVDSSQELDVLCESLLVPCFVLVIQFFVRTLGPHLQQRQIVCALVRQSCLHCLDHLRENAQAVQVERYGTDHIRPLHFYCHFLVRPSNSAPVHLTQGGSSDRLCAVDAVKQRRGGLTQLLLDRFHRDGAVEGRNGVAQLLQFVHRDGTHEVRSDGESLSELNKSGAEPR